MVVFWLLHQTQSNQSICNIFPKNWISILYIGLNHVRNLSVSEVVDVETQVDVWCDFSTEYYGQLSLR